MFPAEDNSERSTKNSVIAWCCHVQLSVTLLLRSCWDAWRLYERILLTNCEDFDQSRDLSDLPREHTVRDGKMWGAGGSRSRFIHCRRILASENGFELRRLINPFHPFEIV